MNDDELIDRLRATLRAEADAVVPGSGVPRVNRVGAPPRLRGVTPRLGALLVAAAVAGAVAVGATVLHPGHRHRVSVIATNPPPVATPPGRTVVRTHLGTPGHRRRSTVPAGPRTAVTAPPTTVAAPSGVAPGFVALSVTFVTAAQGWILGEQPCAAGECLALAVTADGGASWTAQGVAGVALPASAGSPQLQLRFADPDDGWIYGQLAGTAVVLATHDGGASWSSDVLPGLGAGATLEALETADGTVHAVVRRGDGRFVIDDAPVAGSTWTAAALSLPVGSAAGLVVQGRGAWVVVGSTGSTLGGARLDAAGTWVRWTPPCADAPTSLAAPSPTSVTAVCAPSGTRSERVETSTDGGVRFSQTAVVHDAGLVVGAVASPAPGVLAGVGAVDPGTILLSGDGGRSWRAAYSADSSVRIVQIGFEDASQGVAIADTAGAAFVLMTHDGGSDWTVTPLTR